MHAFIISGEEEKERQRSVASLIASWNTHSMDVVLLEPDAESIGIAQVRDFETRLCLAPRASAFTVGVIQNSHLLTPEAQQALLKTLEEPPPRAKIILSLPAVHVLLPTILSRCQLTTATSRPAADEGVRKTLIDLMQATPQQKFTLIDELAKDRQTAADFVQRALGTARVMLHQSAHDNKSIPTTTQWARVARALLRAHTLLSANVTPKLVFDTIFLPIS